MIIDWDAFLARLRAYPPHSHRILPPCAAELIEAVEGELGKLPTGLKSMLGHFNGAELFISGGPYVTFFRISAMPPLPALEWAQDWCIDSFTRKWRAADANRQCDWAIAMTNYGGLTLLDGDGTIKEWDTSVDIWLTKNLPFAEWLEKVTMDGEDVVTATG
jgi:hypothetical protein